MRKLILPLSVGGLVFNAALLAALYSPGVSFAPAVFWVPFIPAALIFGSALLVISGGRRGSLQWDRLWGALVALPRWAQAGLVLLFAATAARMLASQVGPQDELTFSRMFAGNALWITAVGTALHYGMRRGREREPSRRSNRIAFAAFAVVGVALAAAMFVLGRDPIYDERATHDRLTAQFGGAEWHSHLVAANTQHGAFAVYLDTRDATVQADACTDLRPLAAELGRVPSLYYAADGHGRFSRTC
ncbi:hypothetical protein ABZS66_30715 [Dactylosporangium sp. NPDC005572]|uniref:hypothetical protein n=1 Tax=Dactylosporangium sp. NPDC005572 TaxID=3156889 RepID=UPI0033A2C718